MSSQVVIGRRPRRAGEPREARGRGLLLHPEHDGRRILLAHLHIHFELRNSLLYEFQLLIVELLLRVPNLESQHWQHCHLKHFCLYL